MGTRARERERETESARVDALTQSRMDWRTRSSLHRRMIELYLKHRDRLINILEMIDGKERCVCVYLSKIVQWKQRAAATRAVRAGARTRAHTKKRAIDPWSPAEGFEKGWKKSPCTFPADDIFFFFFFLARIHERCEIIYGRRIAVLQRIIFEYRRIFALQHPCSIFLRTRVRNAMFRNFIISSVILVGSKGR